MAGEILDSTAPSDWDWPWHLPAALAPTIIYGLIACWFAPWHGEGIGRIVNVYWAFLIAAYALFYSAAMWIGIFVLDRVSGYQRWLIATLWPGALASAIYLFSMEAVYPETALLFTGLAAAGSLVHAYAIAICLSHRGGTYAGRV